MQRRSLLVPTAVLALAFLLGGCTDSGQKAGAPDDSPVPAAAPSSPAATEKWPAGASAKTPTCQDASAGVVAAVNQTINTAAVAGEGQMRWLSAHPDPTLGVWLLTGLLGGSDGQGGYYLVWGTHDDPRADPFNGDLFTVGGAAAAASSAPPLTPGYVGATDMDDVPKEALLCGTTHATS